MTQQMHYTNYQSQKSHLEMEIGRSQNVIASVNASTEMPEGRKAAYLDWHQPRLRELSAELATLNQTYWGGYNGYSSFGATIGN